MSLKLTIKERVKGITPDGSLTITKIIVDGEDIFLEWGVESYSFTFQDPQQVGRYFEVEIRKG